MTELKIEAGKYYRLRNGEKVFVSEVSLPNLYRAQPPCTIAGFAEIDGRLLNWRADGQSSRNYDPLDIIAEWKEPRKWERTITAYEPLDQPGVVHWSYNESDPFIFNQIIARKTVTIAEGEGVE